MSKRVLITGGAPGLGRALLASSTGLLNTPGMTSYNASKVAVISLSETIRHELAPFGVRTTVVCPGPVRTDLRAGPTSPDPDLAELVDRTIQDSPRTAEQVAGRITDAADRGRFLVLTHPTDRRALCLERLLPRVADVQAARRWRRTAMKLTNQNPQESRRAA
ncbi:SDR family NAD(P)-dependent oxidoreductase [Streptomyces sp. NPDC056528]|uniref:SDR family NAD(P)-dependent oxidoreductase n=1 Tax=Streptomyces sp. NPDC056528 TaxID=3345854 RepID=UPI0036885C39